MVILDNAKEVKMKTVKQIAIITKLLQSRCFSKLEFEDLMMRNIKQVVTSYDASVLITYLISALRFRKKFYSKNHKAHLKCIYCNSKTGLDRGINVSYGKQKVICIACEDKMFEAQQEVAEDRAKAYETLEADANLVNEDAEVSADLYRKYELIQ